MSIGGGLVGLLLGVMNYFGFRKLVAQLSGAGATEASLKRARLLRAVAWFDLIVFPIVGFYIPTIFRGL
jgi:hypothetical protein